MKTQTIESFLEEGMPFTELLPYYGYENGFFVLKDGSLGQAWEVSLIESETKSAAHLEQLAQMIEGVIIRLPEDLVSCQFILICDEDFEDTLQSYRNFAGSFGRVWEVSLIESETKSVAHLEQLAQNIEDDKGQ